MNCVRIIATTLCIAVYGPDGAVILQRQWAALKSHFSYTTITVIITVEQLPPSELYNLTVTPTTFMIHGRYWHRFAHVKRNRHSYA